MSLPAGYIARPVRYPQDLDALAEFLQTCDKADLGSADPVRDWLQVDLGSPRWDREHDRKVVLAEDGSIAGFWNCTWDPEDWVGAYSRVHPDHRGRGLGSTLVEWAERRAVHQVAAGAKPLLHIHVPAPDLAARTLLQARGFENVRTAWEMARSLTDAEPAPSLPAGIECRLMRDPEDLEATHAVVDEAFKEHFGYHPEPFDDWVQEWIHSPACDPALMFLAWEGERLVGAALSGEIEGIGWVGDLVVLKPWRGKGLGEALLRRTFSALAERGRSEVRLEVDAGNETGATRLYERVGMTVRREWHFYRKPVAAG